MIQLQLLLKIGKETIKPQKTVVSMAENTTNNTDINNQIINSLTLLFNEFKNS